MNHSDTTSDRITFIDETDGPTWSLFVAGDCYLQPTRPDDPILASSLEQRVESADIAIANLEAPVRADGTEPIPKSGPALENDPSTPSRLSDAGFDLVSLANNHTMDYGWPSLAQTIATCDDAGLDAVGAGKNRSTAVAPVRHSIAGTSVAVLSVCEREFGVAGEETPGTAWAGHRDTTDAISHAADTADTVVVLAHGGIEYVPFPSPQWRDRLHQFVDRGADLVVAHHPHVPQGWEQYGDGAVFYSLGNFLFDSHTDPATTWGLALDIEFAGGTPVGVDLVPTEVRDSAVHPLGESHPREESIEYLHRLSRITATELRPYWQSVAVRKFYEIYSTWLLTGIGDTLARANAHPYESDAHQPLWDPDRRREELLVLLNVIRNASHRAVITDALSVLTGETTDERTDTIETEVGELLALTTPES